MRTASKNHRGVSLLELVVTTAILSFIVAATARLYFIGQAQQAAARNYSQAQTDLRMALRQVTYAVRHGCQVVTESTGQDSLVKAFATADRQSDAGTLTLRVPEPSGATLPYVELQFYAADGVLYSRRADQSAPGNALLQGVETLAFHYFRTVPQGLGTAAVSVDNAPATATEVQITLAVRRGTVTTQVQTYIMLRNTAGDM